MKLTYPAIIRERFFAIIKKNLSAILRSLGTLKKLKKISLSVSVMLLLMLSPSLYAQDSDSGAEGVWEKKANLEEFTLDAYRKVSNKQFIYGFETIHFFMTLEDVKTKLGELEYDKGVTLEEFDSDIYSYPRSTRQDFVQYNHISQKFLPFTIYSGDMEELLGRIVSKGLDTRVLHLSERFKDDFKLLIVPASLENSRPWEFRFTFFNRQLNGSKVYRLFAISASYDGGEEEQIGNLRIMPKPTLKVTREQIYGKYGFPEYKRSIILGKKENAEKYYENFQRHYVSEDYRYNVNQVKNYSILVQLNLTYVRIGDKLGNFQISYLATDYLRELQEEFNSSQARYKAVDLDDTIEIDF